MGTSPRNGFLNEMRLQPELDYVFKLGEGGRGQDIPGRGGVIYRKAQKQRDLAVQNSKSVGGIRRLQEK